MCVCVCACACVCMYACGECVNFGNNNCSDLCSATDACLDMARQSTCECGVV